MDWSDYKPEHFKWSVEGAVATATISRPEKKNPLTLHSYAELRDTFRELVYNDEIRVVVIKGAEGNFCSGGDVHEIIGRLVDMDMAGLMKFTRMTGDLIKAIREVPQIVIAEIEGICAGAGAAIAMAADLRHGTPDSKVAFLFSRVGLAGCDMGACAFLPRLIGQGRATELLLSGRSMKGEEAKEWGFYNECLAQPELGLKTTEIAERYSKGPTVAYTMTKKMLNLEWNMGYVEALEAEAQAQAICMQTEDFKRAYQAFCDKQKPEFKGN